MTVASIAWPLVTAGALAVALVLSSGPAALLYALLYLVAITPGTFLGRRLVSHRLAGAIAGAALGYGATQLALWIPIALHVPSPPAFVAAWGLQAGIFFAIGRRVRQPIVNLSYQPGDLRSLALLTVLVGAIMTLPYRNLGAADETGTRFYRAYFTADFVWHTALAAELGRYDTPPHNPYMASADLHYYWTYFLLPAVISHEAPGALDDIQANLKSNAVLSAMLMIGMLYFLVRTAVPRPGVAATAVALGMLAASAEGTFVLQQFWRRDVPLRALEDMNIDAITNWQFGGLRVDNVPRSLWYTPQHAFSCALALVAMFVAAATGARASTGAIWLAGVALGLSTCFNPLLGGMFAAIYGGCVVVDAFRGTAPLLAIARHAMAAVPVALALAWGVLNEVAEGAGGAVTIGFSGFARRNTFTSLLLSSGPLLVPALAGLLPWRGLPGRPAVLATIGTVAALCLMHFVVLSEASWVGFRAGQILLLMLPVLLARTLAVVTARGVAAGVALAVAVLVAGLPTTVIDTYNTQDISNRRQGPGFHWTLPVTPAQQAAFNWVRTTLPESATLQMEPMLRGREHWSLIPTFAERRMTAGLPISLLPMPEYDTSSAEIQRLFQTTDPREAWLLARGRGVHYLYVDPDDVAAYAEGVAKFDGNVYFERVYDAGGVLIYKVR